MLVLVLHSQPFFMLVVGLSTYIRPWEEPILLPCQKGTTLTSNHGRNQCCHHVRKAQHLHLTMEGTNPLTMSERNSMDSSLPLGRNLDLENTKILLEVLKIHPSQWLYQYISYLILHRNILELHCSPLHHIPNNFMQLWL